MHSNPFKVCDNPQISAKYGLFTGAINRTSTTVAFAPSATATCGEVWNAGLKLAQSHIMSNQQTKYKLLDILYLHQDSGTSFFLDIVQIWGGTFDPQQVCTEIRGLVYSICEYQWTVFFSNKQNLTSRVSHVPRHSILSACLPSIPCNRAYFL